MNWQVRAEHETALSPEVKLDLNGLKSAIWDQRDTVSALSAGERKGASSCSDPRQVE